MHPSNDYQYIDATRKQLRLNLSFLNRNFFLSSRDTTTGLGTMCISNAVGSNTFDILVCLGLPWLVKTAFLPSDPTTRSILINSEGITYSAIALLSSLVMMYLALFFNRFVLSRRVGLCCCILYILFLIFSLLWELNVFGVVNLPMCPSSA